VDPNIEFLRITSRWDGFLVDAAGEWRAADEQAVLSTDRDASGRHPQNYGFPAVSKEA
jgi:hypothetical protein